jgi:hypothetical protein
MKIRTLLLVTLFTGHIISCSTEVDVESEPIFEIELDSRLDKISDDLYELVLDRGKLQTIHRLSGRLTQDGIKPDLPLKYIGWESSHSWVLTDTLGFVIRRTINSEGQWTNLDTLFVTGFEGFEVPTINPTSVTKDDGTFSGMIAPILPMLGDTMTVKVEYKEGEVHAWNTVIIQLN